MDGAYGMIVFICWIHFVFVTCVDASCRQESMQAESSVRIQNNSAVVEIAFPNVTKCHANVSIACPSQCPHAQPKAFVCSCLKLNKLFNITATVLQDGHISQMDYAVYTTDVQSVSAQRGHGKKAPTVTCHFANGTNCSGCKLDWWLMNTPGPTEHHYQRILRPSNSLLANATIEGLVPGRKYMVVAYDIEWNGTTSTEVGVMLEGGLKLDNEGVNDGDNAGDGDSIVVVASVSVLLLTCICAVSAAVVIIVAKRFKGRISMSQILEHKKREKGRESKKEKQTKEAYEYYIPPLPPRTADMHILVFPENSQMYSGTGCNTHTTVATVECSLTSQDAVGTPNNTLHSKLQGNPQLRPDQSSNPEVVSVCSAETPPPIPPRTNGMLQLQSQSHEPIPDNAQSKGSHFSWLKKLGIGGKNCHSGSSCNTTHPPPSTVERNTLNIDMKYNLAYHSTSEFLAM